MTNEKILKAINTYVASLSDSELKRFTDIRARVKDGSDKLPIVNIDVLAILAGEIDREIINAEYAKTSPGAKKRLEKLQKLIMSNDNLERMRGVWCEDIGGENYTCCLYKTLYGIALSEEVPITKIQCQFELKKAFGFFTPSGESFVIDLPKIRAEYKLYKSDPKHTKAHEITDPCIINIGSQLFNAKYVVDICEILGDEVTIENAENRLSPAILHSKNGSAILCPINPKTTPSA